MSFSQALSGLRGQAENIKVISNNIANSQTVGFKSANVLFADVFAGASDGVGLGVNIAGIQQDFRLGNLENTGRNLDLAIGGKGFYRLERSNGEIVYSRNGEYTQDKDGFLVSGTGQFLTGYTMDENAEDFPFSPVIPGGAPGRIWISQEDIPANQTQEASAIYNLDASTIGTDVSNVDLQNATVIVDPDAGPPPTEAIIPFHFSSSFVVYDSLGNARTVTTYYEKTADNTWTAKVALDGVRPAGNGAADFTFNFTADGLLNIDADNAIDPVAGIADDPDPALGEAGAPGEGQLALVFAQADFNLGGADELRFVVDLASTTQFNNNSVMNTFSQDGYTSGTLIGLEVERDGTVVRTYTNEQRRAAGQIVLANFVNPEGLQPNGENSWRPSITSGEPVLGEAGTGAFGTIEGGVLENSNVDLAQELVNMIVAQRAYQANSGSISTQDEMLQTVLNL